MLLWYYRTIKSYMESHTHLLTLVICENIRHLLIDNCLTKTPSLQCFYEKALQHLPAMTTPWQTYSAWPNKARLMQKFTHLYIVTRHVLTFLIEQVYCDEYKSQVTWPMLTLPHTLLVVMFYRRLLTLHAPGSHIAIMSRIFMNCLSIMEMRWHLAHKSMNIISLFSSHYYCDICRGYIYSLAGSLIPVRLWVFTCVS